MKRVSWILFSLLVLATTAVGQQGYDWGENKPIAQQNWMNLNAHVRERLFEGAKPKAFWLLNNAPNLHEDLYIQAAKIYEGVEKKETDPAKKKVYQDSVLAIYDMRIEKYGNEANVLNRKGRVAFKYLVNDPSKVNELYLLYKKIFELNGQDAYASHAYYYMYISSQKMRSGDLTEEQLLNTYFFLDDFLDAHFESAIANGEKTSTIERSRTQVASILEQSITMDCDRISTIFKEKFEASPDDVKLAKKIYRLSAKSDCFNDMTMLAVEVIAEKEPSVGTSLSLAPIYIKRKQFDKADNEYERALSLTSDPAKKAEIYLEMAAVKRSRGMKSSARSYAQKAIATGQSVAEAYNFIGDLYMYSFDDCKSDDVLATRSIYIAAYEMYQKAGNQQKMAKAKENFPSGTEIFERNKEVGQEVSTGCWIGETVKLQKR